MGKPVKKRSVCDKVRKSSAHAQIKTNPFEVKINKKKFDVLGRKSKHDVGLPGVSRSKAHNKVTPGYLISKIRSNCLVYLSCHSVTPAAFTSHSVSYSVSL